MEALTKNLQAGLEAELLICPRRESEEELSSKCQRELDVKVLIEPAEDVASLRIFRKENDDFHVKFVPKVPGTYNMTVKINGNKLVTSPFFSFPFMFDKDGNYVRKFGFHGIGPGQLIYPTGVTFLNDDKLLVVDGSNCRIQQFNVQTGNFVKSFGKVGSEDGEFRRPEGITINNEGHVILADCFNDRIQVLDKDGKFMFKFGDDDPGKLNAPSGCIYHKDKFIVSDSGNHCLKLFDKSGKFLYEIGEEGEADGQFASPWGLCVEKYGDHQNLLVCDRENERIQQFTMEGRFSGKTVIKLKDPRAIATTPDGRILVCDWGGEKIHILK